MKRLITTYVVKPDMLKEFMQASNEFATQTREQDRSVLEFTISKNNQTISHYISFADQDAELLHKKAPRTQVFVKMAQTLCAEKPHEINLPEHGLKTGVCATSSEQEKREQDQVCLHKNQDEIERIAKNN